MIERVMIAGGGTGGHLFPGLSVLEELRRRNPSLSAVFIGTERGIESRVLPSLEEKLEVLDVRPLMGRSPLELLRSLSRLPLSGVHAVSTVRKYRPQLVIGLGGYVAGPVLLAAAAQRIPTVLLEQNAHVGLTNRMLAKVVGRAYLTYEETLPVFGAERGRVLGNPVRRAFVEAAKLASHDPDGAEARAQRILVLGGSQGARRLNELVPQALALAGVGEMGVEILHQAGRDEVDAVFDRYGDVGLNAEVVPFIDDMVRAYTSASLVIGRAGATTVAELCAIGRPSILIPYPYAAEDHQAKNAEALARAGAAIAIRENLLEASGLSAHVRRLLSDHDARRRMAERARERGRPDAAAAIVDDILAWLGFSDGGDADPGKKPRGTDAPPKPGGQAASSATHRLAVTRRPRVQRCQLSVRPIDLPFGPPCASEPALVPWQSAPRG
ncbi:MAG: undecaprenyldiphospho-muramoylpentapeptide beta-N-acetylglucosaminyltransferase [Myxococcales bacterium]|nr:undecaprenyldiphospho-muramoylpentapeptide beta-N-acetylglucosaminyltransferase [Myxococcales bacterium]